MRLRLCLMLYIGRPRQEIHCLVRRLWGRHRTRGCPASSAFIGVYLRFHNNAPTPPNQLHVHSASRRDVPSIPAGPPTRLLEDPFQSHSGPGGTYSRQIFTFLPDVYHAWLTPYPPPRCHHPCHLPRRGSHRRTRVDSRGGAGHPRTTPRPHAPRRVRARSTHPNPRRSDTPSTPGNSSAAYAR